MYGNGANPDARGTKTPQLSRKTKPFAVPSVNRNPHFYLLGNRLLGEKMCFVLDNVLSGMTKRDKQYESRRNPTQDGRVTTGY